METKFKKQLEGFFGKFRLIKYRKNEVLYRPGDSFAFVNFLKSGYLRIYTISSSGQEATIHIFRPSSLLPFFTNEKIKRGYYIETLSPVEIWQAPKDEFTRFLAENTTLLSEFIDETTLSFKEALIRIEYLASGDAYTKVTSTLFLLVNAEKPKKSTAVPLDFTATHRLIASMTGLTRETVTLQMLKLKKKGLISGKGRRLVIADLQKLKQEFAPEE